MAWWGLLYLLILILLGIAGITEQFRTKQTAHGLLTLLSLLIFSLFIYAFFHDDIAATLGLWSIPLLLVATAYDWWISNIDLESSSENYLKPLPDSKSRLNDMSALLIILPAYLAGATVCYRAIMNAF